MYQPPNRVLAACIGLLFTGVGVFLCCFARQMQAYVQKVRGKQSERLKWTTPEAVINSPSYVNRVRLCGVICILLGGFCFFVAYAAE
jgi:hypothetical protein